MPEETPTPPLPSRTSAKREDPGPRASAPLLEHPAPPRRPPLDPGPWVPDLHRLRRLVRESRERGPAVGGSCPQTRPLLTRIRSPACPLSCMPVFRGLAEFAASLALRT